MGYTPGFGKYNSKKELICQVLFLNSFRVDPTNIGRETGTSYSRVNTMLKNYSKNKEYIKIVDGMIKEHKEKKDSKIINTLKKLEDISDDLLGFQDRLSIKFDPMDAMVKSSHIYHIQKLINYIQNEIKKNWKISDKDFKQDSF